MHVGELLVIIGTILVALDWILDRSGHGSRTFFGLIHLGVVLIGVGILVGGTTLVTK